MKNAILLVELNACIFLAGLLTPQASANAPCEFPSTRPRLPSPKHTTRASVLPVATASTPKDATEQELAKEFVPRALEVFDRHTREVAALQASHPELQEIPALRQWLATLPETLYPEGGKPWKEAAKQSREAGEHYYVLMHLQTPSVLLALMEDPQHGRWVNATLIASDFILAKQGNLQVLDHITSYPGPPLKAASRDTLKAELESRTAHYAAYSKKRMAESGITLSQDLRGHMLTNILKEVLTEYLAAYPRYLSPAMEELTTQVKELDDIFRRLIKTDYLTPNEKKRYWDAREKLIWTR